jgi:5-methylcytosine-specific restriction endonuclease McrA
VSCLALNASFEPLTIVTTRRAVRLVLDGKAELLEADAGRVFRSEERVVPCPSVIRLVRYVHVPYRFRRQVTNTFLFARDDYTCQYCGRRKGDLRGRQFLTRDHIRPLSRGGLNTWDNVVTSCSTCNNRKGGRLPSEAGLALLNAPTEPNYVHLVWVVRRVTDAQAKYIKMFYGEDALEAVSSRPARGHRSAMEQLSPAAAAELVAAQSSSQA